eukprot:12468581-Alexandrium_andersonii.AAC.1
MSASLVGSEMCIRDSVGGSPDTNTGAGGAGRRQSRKRAGGAFGGTLGEAFGGASGGARAERRAEPGRG